MYEFAKGVLFTQMLTLPLRNSFRAGEQIQHLWDVLDIGETTTDEVFATRVYDVLPSNPVFSHYMGSLTTPPCTEVRKGRYTTLERRTSADDVWF